MQDIHLAVAGRELEDLLHDETEGTGCHLAAFWIIAAFIMRGVRFVILLLPRPLHLYLHATTTERRVIGKLIPLQTIFCMIGFYY